MMKLRVNIVRVLLFIFTLCHFSEVATAAPWQEECGQVVLVETSDWLAMEGDLRTFQKVRNNWVEVGKAIPVSVGGNGLGWGLGLHRTRNDEPQKREGDRRAPAGIFWLKTGFGTKRMPNSRFPVLVAGDGDLWIDDPKSQSYNRWVNERDSKIPHDWESFEVLNRADGLYDYAIVVEHNMNPPVPWRGSAIFMHIWSRKGKPTIGCTAMEKSRLELLMRWLDPSSNPVLIQVPGTELENLQLPPGLKQALR